MRTSPHSEVCVLRGHTSAKFVEEDAAIVVAASSKFSVELD